MVEVTDLKEDPLEKKGWRRRSILEEPRLSEVMQMYKDLGLEVLVKDVKPEDLKLPESCTECIDGKFKVIYTRPKKGAKGTNEIF
jgi:signal recognition particle subunit SEC65